MAVLAIFAVSSVSASTAAADLDTDGGRQVFGSVRADCDFTTFATFGPPPSTADHQGEQPLALSSQGSFGL